MQMIFVTQVSLPFGSIFSTLINGADAKKKGWWKEKEQNAARSAFVYIAHDARKVKVVQSAYTSVRDTFTFGVQHTSKCSSLSSRAIKHKQHNTSSE